MDIKDLSSFIKHNEESILKYNSVEDCDEIHRPTLTAVIAAWFELHGVHIAKD